VNDDLKDMLKISHGVGTDPRLVQGGGGNTSVETAEGERMYVKASGTGLAEMREGSGYRLVDVRRCLAILQDEQLQQQEPEALEKEVLRRLQESCLDDLEGRPSVETSLHALLGRCVVHTHPSPVNGLLCAEDGREVLDGLFQDMEPPSLYVEFCGAGFPLALRMQSELSDYRRRHGRLPEVIFLENHGMFVSSDQAERALEVTADVFDTIDAAARKAIRDAALPALAAQEEADRDAAAAHVMAAARRFYTGLFGRPALARFADGPVVTEFLRNPQAQDLAAVEPLTPDQVVYCKAAPVWVDLPADTGSIQETVTADLQGRDVGPDNTPTCMLVGGLGLVSAAPSPGLLDAVSATMHAALETLSIASQFGGPRPLSDEMIQWMRVWEVERFRHKLVAGEAAGDELAGTVALVTGAGSGIGRGISQYLARIGVHVVLADVDVPAAEETTAAIASQEGSGRGFPVRADVTDEKAVADAINCAVQAVGGLDLLVNCAGIAPAHPLTNFPADKWRLTLEINLTGYFLMAREAARCMIRQGTGGSIINISSKSGLYPSRNNSAYNATKAGEIHLARGWALELADHDIRVNVVCPGNIFSGSKIWNEDYIKAIAAKRNIKPDEVIPYYTNMTALKKEIVWDDIGQAVAFLASSRASKITGQSLVVDAGQVFVR
jgi:NAD(P)-dependent dehydrogenase (short-subunit alcohol dehydrogenase family)/rhamnose utilization protein RhaD (predicted bifunctional aldolase and dehydrogenase)